MEHHWKHAHTGKNPRVIVIAEDDKRNVRNNIMPAILDKINNKSIIEQYKRALRKICIYDYPDKLPNLFS